MADSNITKQALALSLIELMEKVPFEKINVAQICEGCGMNRKSFYYHFRDKYDLVNWIFDTEFTEGMARNADMNSYADRWKMIEDSCTYFYENRNFYRKALQIKGQNSFPDHFREFIQPIWKNRFSDLFGSGQADELLLDCLADSTIDAMVRWLDNKECIPAEQFIEKLKLVIYNMAESVYLEFESR